MPRHAWVLVVWMGVFTFGDRLGLPGPLVSLMLLAGHVIGVAFQILRFRRNPSTTER